MSTGQSASVSSSNLELTTGYALMLAHGDQWNKYGRITKPDPLQPDIIVMINVGAPGLTYEAKSYHIAERDLSSDVTAALRASGSVAAYYDATHSSQRRWRIPGRQNSAPRVGRRSATATATQTRSYTSANKQHASFVAFLEKYAGLWNREAVLTAANADTYEVQATIRTSAASGRSAQKPFKMYRSTVDFYGEYAPVPGSTLLRYDAGTSRWEDRAFFSSPQSLLASNHSRGARDGH